MTKPVEKFYIKYYPKNNLLTHEAIIPNHIYNEVTALASAICVTNEANQNSITSQKDHL